MKFCIRNSNVVNGGRVLYKAVTKDKFWAKTNFPVQIIKLYPHNYLVLIILKKMSSGGNKKTTKNRPNKNSKENSIVITMEEMLEQKFKSYKENIKSYLAAKNDLLSKKINELNDKLSNLQSSREYSDKKNLQKFKAIDRNVSHINGTFQNHANITDNRLYEIEEKLCYLEGSSRKSNLITEGVEEEEIDKETCKEEKSKQHIKILT